MKISLCCLADYYHNIIINQFLCPYIHRTLINCLCDSHTVKPLNSGHIGGEAIVRCREIVPISEVGWPATPLNPEVVNGLLIQRGVACEKLNQQIRADTL